MKFRNFFVIFFGLSALVVTPEILLPAKEVTLVALSLSVLIVIFGLIAKRFQSRIFKLFMLLSGFGLLFTWSVHAIKYLFNPFWVITIILVGGLISIGLFPKYNKNLAERIYTESMLPKTMIGKLLIKFLIPISYIVSILGVSFGIFSREQPINNKPLQWIIAVGVYLIVVALVFYVMNDYYENKTFVWGSIGSQTKRNTRAKK